MSSIAKFVLRVPIGQLSRRSVRHHTVTTTRSASTPVTTTSTKPKDSNNSMESLKIRLARAALKQVPRHGWTQDAIAAATMEDPKLSISMSGMLSPPELVNWFMDDMNQQLRTKNEEIYKSNDNDENDNKQFEAIQWRLKQVLPFVESGQWHRGMAMGLSTPMTTQSQLHEFIELISPDNCSTAYHTALGATFITTELHLLTDSSPNYVETWSFLKSRLDELERQQREYGDVDPAQFFMQFASSAPIPSISSLTNMTNSIPAMAGMAVATSLVEGAASLVFSPSFRVSPPSIFGQSESMNGTKASDYVSPPVPTRESSQK